IDVLIAVEPAQVDLLRVSLRDPLDQRALLNAIAAPDAREADDVDLADKRPDQLLLRVGEPGLLVNLPPVLLLLGRAGGDILGIRQPGLVLLSKISRIHRMTPTKLKARR